MSKIKNYKVNYFSGDIRNKGHYLQIEIIENGIAINCKNYSEIDEIKTFIINEDCVIIEARIKNG